MYLNLLSNNFAKKKTSLAICRNGNALKVTLSADDDPCSEINQSVKTRKSHFNSI